MLIITTTATETGGIPPCFQRCGYWSRLLSSRNKQPWVQTDLSCPCHCHPCFQFTDRHSIWVGRTNPSVLSPREISFERSPPASPWNSRSVVPPLCHKLAYSNIGANYTSIVILHPKRLSFVTRTTDPLFTSTRAILGPHQSLFHLTPVWMCKAKVFKAKLEY
jgi:hypothetical protein